MARNKIHSKIYIFTRKQLLFYLFSVVIFCGCSSYKHSIYNKGDSYLYEVSFINENNDTTNACTLTMFILSDNKIKYLYSQCDKQDYLEMTTYKEDKNSIDLHPPRMGSLSFTGILPFPTYSYPIGCIAEATGEVVIKKSSFKQANGKTITYEYRQDGEDSLNAVKKNLKCFIVKGKNTNYEKELGQYYVKYWFNTTYGFVKWEYILPNEKRVVLLLKECFRDK